VTSDLIAGSCDVVCLVDHYEVPAGLDDSSNASLVVLDDSL